mmetsp:Transcript_21936/g.66661  ORF Transcript_21936/g.66661 Transcript_21936/m.66661 type:complete len:83 (-) Transcript_21936:478-726(-)
MGLAPMSEPSPSWDAIHADVLPLRPALYIDWSAFGTSASPIAFVLHTHTFPRGPFHEMYLAPEARGAGLSWGRQRPRCRQAG